MENIGIDGIYEIYGEDYNILIRPTNASIDKYKTIYLGDCEDKLRDINNISSSSILTALQMDIYNKNDYSLINDIKYAIFNDNKVELDLSVCKNIKKEIDQLKISIINEKYKNYFNNIIKSNNTITNKDKIIENIKKELINGSLFIFIENTIEKEKEDLIFEENNIIYQLTSSYNQKYNEYKNISSINLRECETRLRISYNISNSTTLLILKIDIFEKGLLIPIVEYEIYNSKIKEKLDLEICHSINIDLYIPVVINEDKIFKYNSSDEYYNDFCYPYTTQNKTDITIKDRRDEFINNNLSL